jgi:hypothetical protein
MDCGWQKVCAGGSEACLLHLLWAWSFTSLHDYVVSGMCSVAPRIEKTQVRSSFTSLL